MGQAHNESIIRHGNDSLDLALLQSSKMAVVVKSAFTLGLDPVLYQARRRQFQVKSRCSKRPQLLGEKHSRSESIINVNFGLRSVPTVADPRNNDPKRELFYRKNPRDKAEVTACIIHCD